LILRVELINSNLTNGLNKVTNGIAVLANVLFLPINKQPRGRIALSSRLTLLKTACATLTSAARTGHCNGRQEFNQNRWE
jgi:hypothetical protein